MTESFCFTADFEDWDSEYNLIIVQESGAGTYTLTLTES